jgi:hypothetical protein
MWAQRFSRRKSNRARDANLFLGSSRVRLTYDIFRRLPDNSPIWVEAVEGLDQAKQRLLQLASSSPDEYVLYDSRAQKFITPSGDNA